MGVNYDYRDIFNGVHTISLSESYDINEIYKYSLDGVPEKIGFAIVNYSVKDPTVAPPGKNVINITAYLPYDWKNGWYENEDYAKYRALKEEVAKILIKRAEKILPGLESHIEVMEVGSPHTMEHFTLNPKGAVLGWATTMDQYNKRLPQETPIKNLLLAGAWTKSFGQNMVMRSGLTAADKILAMENKTIPKRK
jgi:prolycopene isomerase